MGWKCKCGHDNLVGAGHYATHCANCGMYWGDAGAVIVMTTMPVSPLVGAYAVYIRLKALEDLYKKMAKSLDTGGDK